MGSKSPSRRTPKSEATRAQILATALSLFNAHGTAAVSTNRIAAELGMSPGNLYYHYADKKEIIRDLLADLTDAYGQHWQLDDGLGRAQALTWLRESLVRGSELAWRYRFFGREMVALLRADPELAASYRDAYQHRLTQWSAFADRLVEHGLLRPPPSLADLIMVIWLVAENWITHLELTGDPDVPAQVTRRVDLVLAVLEPHLTPQARQLWKETAADDT